MSPRFKIKLAILTRLIGMSVITVFAVLVMIAVNLKGRKIEQTADVEKADSLPARVTVINPESEAIEITQKYSGTIRPFERYLLSFKSGGRVSQLGKNKQGDDLDEGDPVHVGMELARLDTRLLEAQKAELLVAKDFAQKEYDLVAQSTGAISESEMNRRKTELDAAIAKIDVIQTQIDDGILRSRVDGVISKRLVKAGESVSLGQAVFEVVQVKQVKLVVGVPESRVRKLIDPASRDRALKAYVQLIGQDNVDTEAKPLNGTVHKVGQTSDEQSGLFDVEIILDNEKSELRPGMIGIARIVVDRVDGIRIPADVSFSRENETFVFVVYKKQVIQDKAGEDEPNPIQQLESLFEEKIYVARKYLIDPADFEIEGDDLVVRNLDEQVQHIIVGGHRRLVDFRRVKVVSNQSINIFDDLVDLAERFLPVEVKAINSRLFRFSLIH